MEFQALAERHRLAEQGQTKRAVLIAVTLCRLQGQEVGMEDFMPELEGEAQEAKALRLLAYFESIAARPPQ